MDQPKRILIIAGTRPEVIKLAPVYLMMKNDERFCPVFCATGQHQEMMDQMLKIFNIKSDFYLDSMRPGQTLALLTSSLLKDLDRVCSIENIDWVLVQGDTTSALTGAMVAFYRKIPIGHVEAGLRTFDKYSPFPEEVNRRTIGVMADRHYAPTLSAARNLSREGISSDRILVTGNTVVDALMHIIQDPMDFSQGIVAQLPAGKKIILVTTHRRESFGKPLEDICEALLKIAALHGQRVCIIFPMHLNPQVRAPVSSRLSGVANLILTDPLDYRSMAYLMRMSHIILTDSGGIQEEASVFGIPVLVLRDKTERSEGIAAGVARLVGTDPSCIVEEVSRLLLDDKAYQAMSRTENPYGDGQAAQRICNDLADQE